VPFATHRGQRIHYGVEGRGPTVVLQHGLFMDGPSWKAAGFVDALKDRFQVVSVDSLGHGQSDKPTEPALYAQSQRAGDIVAVLDDLGAERAHLVGYSMGGWISVGVAKHHPQRLASLVIGGWDPVGGMPSGPAGPLSFPVFMGYARAVAPELVSWITPGVEAGIGASFEALRDLEGSGAALRALKVPVLLWDGRADPYHPAAEVLAKVEGYEFLSVEGDHLSACMKPEPKTFTALRDFLIRAS
jgi:pimeloyl-ACP methyl ester carboxylesterase